MHTDSKAHDHKGYYCICNNYTKNFLKGITIDKFSEIAFDDPSETCPYTNAGDFLMGSCELFALALHQKYGHQVYEIIDKKGKLIHCFCITEHEGAKIYIDVRGATSDFKEFMSEIGVEKSEDYIIRPRNTSEDEKLSDEWDWLAVKFACAIIDQTPDYYTI